MIAPALTAAYPCPHCGVAGTAVTFQYAGSVVTRAGLHAVKCRGGASGGCGWVTRPQRSAVEAEAEWIRLSVQRAQRTVAAEARRRARAWATEPETLVLSVDHYECFAGTRPDGTPCECGGRLQGADQDPYPGRIFWAVLNGDGRRSRMNAQGFVEAVLAKRLGFAPSPHSGDTLNKLLHEHGYPITEAAERQFTGKYAGKGRPQRPIIERPPHVAG